MEMNLLPMEINPEVLNEFLRLLGFLPTFQFVDILGFDEEYLTSLKHDPCAVMLLFPLSTEHEEFRQKQAEELKGVKYDDYIFFMKQTVNNSCALVALCHAAGNNTERVSFDHYSPMMHFLDKGVDSNPEERADIFEESKELLDVHNDVAKQAKCKPNEDSHFHIVTFVPILGNLHEFDGLTEKPIDHGPSSYKTLLQDAGKVCREFIERGKGDVRFTAVALVKVPVPAYTPATPATSVIAAAIASSTSTPTTT